jgi:hypothetical protein
MSVFGKKTIENFGFWDCPEIDRDYFRRFVTKKLPEDKMLSVVSTNQDFFLEISIGQER